VCVCFNSLSYSACKGHAPYDMVVCHLAVAFFLHYSTNGTIFGKELLNIKRVFWFSPQLLSETFLTLRRIKRDIIVNVHTYSCKVLVIRVRFLMKREFSGQIFEKYSYQIQWQSVKWEPHCSMRTDGQTERQAEANSRCSQFCDGASNPISRGVPASDAHTSCEGQSSQGERVNCAKRCRNFFPIRCCYR